MLFAFMHELQACCKTMSPLQVLLEITKICQTEAAALLVTSQSIAQLITDALKASRARRQQHVADASGDDDDLGSSNIDEVKAYFAQHHHRQAQAEDDAADTVDPGELPATYGVLFWIIICICLRTSMTHAISD